MKTDEMVEILSRIARDEDKTPPPGAPRSERCAR